MTRPLMILIALAASSFVLAGCATDYRYDRDHRYPRHAYGAQPESRYAYDATRERYRAYGVHTPRIDARQADQRARIRDGVRHGLLTASEADRLRDNQARIARLEAEYEADGVLSRRERDDLRQRLDRQDRLISQLLHNRYHG